MARFSSIACGIFVLSAAVTLLQAQTVRHRMPVQRPNPPTTLAPQTPQQTLPPQAPTGAPAPAAGISQTAQPAVQPAAQPAAQPSPIGSPVAPVVTYRDGLLSVQAMNSNLSSVVTAIRNKTGIEFEGAEGISERVALALGPAPEGEVLAAIFSGSRYDFLAVGRPDSPNIVQKVILTVKNKPGAGAEAQAQQQQPPANQGEGEDVPDEQVNSGDPQDTPVQPVPVPQQPPQAETPQNQQPKTPEQLLQELQQMRQQKGSPPDPTNNPYPAPRKMPPN